MKLWEGEVSDLSTLYPYNLYPGKLYLQIVLGNCGQLPVISILR